MDVKTFAPPRFYYELIRILAFYSVCAMAVTTRIPTLTASSDFEGLLGRDHGIVTVWLGSKSFAQME